MVAETLTFDDETVPVNVVILVPGKPETGSFRFTRSGHKFTPANVAEWRAFVRLLVTEAVAAMIPPRHPVEVTILLRRPRPQSPKKPTPKVPCPWAWTTKPDVDNCTKGLFDALKTVAFADDAQVTDLIVRKRWAEREEVEIRVRQMLESEFVDGQGAEGQVA